MHNINLIPAYVPTHINVKVDYLSQKRFVPEWHLLLCIAETVFQLWGQLRVDLLTSTCTNQCQHYYNLENPLPLRTLEWDAFNHPRTVKWVMFPPPALVSLVLPKSQAEHVTGSFRLLILVAPCLMEATWFPTVPNMLDDIPCWCAFTNNLAMYVSMDWALKGLSLLQLSLWLLRDVCCSDRGSLPLSVRQWQGQLKHLGQKLPAVLEGMGHAQEGIYCSAISAFLSLLITRWIQIILSSINILMHYFYFSIPFHVNCLIHRVSTAILIVTTKCCSLIRQNTQQGFWAFLPKQ